MIEAAAGGVAARRVPELPTRVMVLYSVNVEWIVVVMPGSSVRVGIGATLHGQHMTESFNELLHTH